MAASAEKEGELVTVTVAMMSGKSTKVALPSSGTVSQLRREAAAALELGAKASILRLVHGERTLSDSSVLKMSLKEAGVEDGALLHAAVSGGCMMELPEHFSMTVSARSPIRSSAFTAEYVVQADIPANTATVELWRKNDHDTVTYDTLAGTLTTVVEHWMTGSQQRQEALGISVPLRELLLRRIAGLEEVVDEADRFWLLPDSSMPLELPPETSGRLSIHSDDWQSLRPLRGRGPHPDSWVAPDDRCSERTVGADIPTASRGSLLILRLLLDPSGRPIRAAIATPRGVPNHSQVEEYEITFDGVPLWQKMESHEETR